MPRISVVVVSWNGLDLLRPCVDALRAQTLPHELVIVDNGSSDGTAAWVHAAVPEARFISLPHNLGFAGGNNAGLRAATGDTLVLINNDTVPPPHFLAEITEPLETWRSAGAVAGVLTFAHRPDLVASAGIVPARDGVHRDARMLDPVATLPREPQEIFGASGGAMCLRRSALEDVGLFEARFFNYLEDADLAWRLRLRGWSAVLAPQALVPHVYSATSGHFSPFKQRLLALNRWRVLLRNVPTLLLRRCAVSILRYELLAVAYGIASGNLAVVAGRVDALRELRLLLRERREIARTASVSSEDFIPWLEAPPGSLSIWRERRALAEVLRSRSI